MTLPSSKKTSSGSAAFGRAATLGRAAASVAAFALLSLVPTSAYAVDNDCPPGSTQKSEDGFTWCQPSVCLNDSQCNPSEVCRPIALCMEVGTLGDAAAPVGTKDASAQRLAVTQRCVSDQTCPQKQTCSKLSRCVAKTTAEKMGILADPAAASASAASASPSGDAPKKSSCGCRTVGSERSSSPLAAACALIAGLALVRRRARARA